MVTPEALKKWCAHLRPVLEPYSTIGWHGTDLGSAKDIITYGFDLSRSTRSCWLGSGVYFYEDWTGQKLSSLDAAIKFAENHRNARPPAVIQCTLNFQNYFDLDRANRDFYNMVRDHIVNSLSRDELDQITVKVENFVLAYIKHAWPECKNIDGVGRYFDGTPAPGLGHAIVAVRKTTCVATRILLP